MYSICFHQVHDNHDFDDLDDLDDLDDNDNFDFWLVAAGSGADDGLGYFFP